MKKIEQEYTTYEIPEEIKENIKDPYALILNIDSLVKELEKQEAMALRRRRRNRIAQKVMIGAEDLLKEEESCWEKAITVIDENLDRLIGIVELIDEETYPELVKLVDFMVSKYTGNLAYCNGQIESLKTAVHGIQMIDYRNQFTHPEVMAFVDSKINGIKKAKKLEKN